MLNPSSIVANIEQIAKYTLSCLLPLLVCYVCHDAPRRSAGSTLLLSVVSSTAEANGLLDTASDGYHDAQLQNCFRAAILSPGHVVTTQDEEATLGEPTITVG
jgi:hypothetical protein